MHALFKQNLRAILFQKEQPTDESFKQTDENVIDLFLTIKSVKKFDKDRIVNYPSDNDKIKFNI